jgi:integrase
VVDSSELARVFPPSLDRFWTTKIGGLDDALARGKAKIETRIDDFRRADVQHKNWYCQVRLPTSDRYKTVSLKISDFDAARDRAFDQDSELRFRVKHDVPIFSRPFSQIAKDFVELTRQRWEAGEITKHRWRVIESHVRTQLNRYVGTTQISLIEPTKWSEYPIWRQANGKGRSGGRVSPGTIRDELATFRAIMVYAAAKRYISDSQIPKGRLPLSRERREEFTPAEYRKLHTFARPWVNEAIKPQYSYYRTVLYNFILIMCNTGMRPSEARNLKWRDIEYKTHRDGQNFVILNVSGKKKFRSLVAADSVGEYLERIRQISKATKPDDRVFTNWHGEPTKSLYYDLLVTLLTDADLLTSSTGKRRSVYCFRHTYATFRLMEGVDIYFLAKQMGTSVQMIETHYGHINPVKHAERILVGLPGWAPGPADGTQPAPGAGVHAEAAEPSSDSKGAPKKRVRPSKAH